MKLINSLGIDKNSISLENLVVGYKIEDSAYFDINYILTIISFSLYKAYYVSEKKRKNE